MPTEGAFNNLGMKQEELLEPSHVVSAGIMKIIHLQSQGCAYVKPKGQLWHLYPKEAIRQPSFGLTLHSDEILLPDAYLWDGGHRI